MNGKEFFEILIIPVWNGKIFSSRYTDISGCFSVYTGTPGCINMYGKLGNS